MTNPFGIYVHIPFCLRRCSYCSFYSSTELNQNNFQVLTQSVIREAETAATWLKPHGTQKVKSIYVGGGTPSLLPVEFLSQILKKLATEFMIDHTAEVTVEANPETITHEWCKQLAANTNVNRLSLGVQSFQSRHLKTLERLSSPHNVLGAVELLHRYGFSNLNLDLIFGIPGQTLSEYLADIDQAAKLQPTHISTYMLTLKPSHPIYGGLPTDDELATFYEKGVQCLESHRYRQYEISNFSRDNQPSQHNWLYWDGGDFLGLGPSACSRFYWDRCFYHRSGVSNLDEYFLRTNFPEPGLQKSTPQQSVLEAVFLELRKNVGIQTAQFEKRYGYDIRQSSRFAELVSEGFIENERQTVRLSPTGRLLADSLAVELVDYECIKS
ncbi:MAG: radical SAM family heme chaperone HemW [Deltaproteobacteria bacterium]|nr:radical SAM family heme chaperone HemW [Deltaproteobacteria bacterium]